MQQTAKDKLIKLAGIAPQSVVNGVGLRKVYFAQGCIHKCEGCFNKHTWDFDGGYWYDMDELIEVLKDETYLDGVTFSGGDPIEQADKFYYLANKIKSINLNIWLYTGYTWEQLMDMKNKNNDLANLLNLIDVVVDGKFVQSLFDEKIKFRGSTNQRIIDVQQSLKDNTIVELTF